MSEFDFRKMYEEIYRTFTYNEGMVIDPAKTALVIIDMQKAFTSSKYGGLGGAFSKILKVGISYFENRVQELVIPNHVRLLEYFRRHGMTVVYIVTWSETDDLSDMPRYQQRTIRHWESMLGEQVYRKWNRGMDIWEQMAPQGHELVLPKRTGSAFASSMLPSCLQNAGIETVVLTGCNTNGCVFQTAVVGKNLGYDQIVVSDATACFAPVLQAEAETWLDRHFAQVLNTEETLALVASAKPSPAR